MMQLTTICIILVAASAGSASPITARQTAHGSANLYSGATCNAANLIQANATVSSDSCTVLDEAVGSVRYNGIADWPSDDAYLWPRTFQPYPFFPLPDRSAACAELHTQSSVWLANVAISSAKSEACSLAIVHPQQWAKPRWGPSE